MPGNLNKYGEEITEGFITGNFGKNKIHQKLNDLLISDDRISDLKTISRDDFDLKKAIQICLEINFNYKYGNYFSTGMLIRALLDHFPPIFGYTTFKDAFFI